MTHAFKVNFYISDYTTRKILAQYVATKENRRVIVGAAGCNGFKFQLGAEGGGSIDHRKKHTFFL